MGNCSGWNLLTGCWLKLYYPTKLHYPACPHQASLPPAPLPPHPIHLQSFIPCATQGHLILTMVPHGLLSVLTSILVCFISVCRGLGLLCSLRVLPSAWLPSAWLPNQEPSAQSPPTLRCALGSRPHHRSAGQADWQASTPKVTAGTAVIKNTLHVDCHPIPDWMQSLHNLSWGPASVVVLINERPIPHILMYRCGIAFIRTLLPILPTPFTFPLVSETN